MVQIVANPAVAKLVESDVYTCPTTVSVRDAVFVSGTDAVDRTDANGSATFPSIGLVRSKPSATTCIVQYSGEMGGFTGLTAGAVHYMSETLGQITATAPTADGSVVQPVGAARTATDFVIMPSVDVTEL